MVYGVNTSVYKCDDRFKFILYCLYMNYSLKNLIIWKIEKKNKLLVKSSWRFSYCATLLNIFTRSKSYRELSILLSFKSCSNVTWCSVKNKYLSQIARYENWIIGVFCWKCVLLNKTVMWKYLPQRRKIFEIYFKTVF